jgi:hypothetical protein
MKVMLRLFVNDRVSIHTYVIRSLEVHFANNTLPYSHIEFQNNLNGDICYDWWTCFSTDHRNSYVHHIYTSSSRLFPLFVWGRFHGWASHENEMKLDRFFHFIFHYSHPFTYTTRSTSYLDIHLTIDSWNLTTK